MSSLMLLKYQFDGTGKRPTNKIVDEPHSLVERDLTLIVPREGLFYTDGFVIRPSNDVNHLIEGTDYDFVSIDPFITAKTGLETACAIRIKKPNLRGEFVITYQCVGGHEGRSNALVKDLIEAIEAAKDHTINWTDIVNKPAQYPPEYHNHELVSITGWDAMVRGLDDLVEAILSTHSLASSSLALKRADERILVLIAELRRDLLAFGLDLAELTERLKRYMEFDIDFGTIGQPTRHAGRDVFFVGHVDLGVISGDEPNSWDDVYNIRARFDHNPSGSVTNMTPHLQSLVWEGYTLPSEISDYYTPGDQYEALYPSVVMSRDGRVVVMTSLWQWHGEHSGTADVPLFKVKIREGTVWRETNVFYPDIAFPRMFFDNYGALVSPNGRWIVIHGGDVVGRASALVFEVVGTDVHYRQHLIVDQDVVNRPEINTQGDMAFVPNDVGAWPGSGIEEGVANGTFNVGDVVQATTEGSLTFSDGRVESFKRGSTIYFTNRTGPSDYNTYVTEVEFAASEQASLSNSALIIGHIRSDDAGDSWTMRHVVYSLEGVNWLAKQVISSERDAGNLTEYALTASAVAISPNSDSLFIEGYKNGAEGGSNGLSLFTLYNNRYIYRTFIGLTEAQTNDLGIEFGELGWCFDISDDGETVIMMDPNQRLILFKKTSDAWAPTCISHHASDSVVPADLRMTVPLPDNLEIVDYQYNHYAERKIAISGDGKQLIVSGIYGGRAGTAIFMSIDDAGTMAYMRTLDPQHSPETVDWDMYTNRFIVGGGRTGDIYMAFDLNNTDDWTYVGTSVVGFYA